MERFITIFNGLNSITIIANLSSLDVCGFLAILLIRPKLSFPWPCYYKNLTNQLTQIVSLIKDMWSCSDGIIIAPKKVKSSSRANCCLKLVNIVIVHQEIYRVLKIAWFYNDDIISASKISLKFRSFLKATCCEKKMNSVHADMELHHSVKATWLKNKELIRVCQNRSNTNSTSGVAHHPRSGKHGHCCHTATLFFQGRTNLQW